MGVAVWREVPPQMLGRVCISNPGQRYRGQRHGPELEHVLSRWRQYHWKRRNVSPVAIKLELQPLAQPRIANLRLVPPKAGSQFAIDAQMPQFEFNSRKRLRECLSYVSCANKKSGNFPALAFRPDHHSAPPFGVGFRCESGGARASFPLQTLALSPVARSIGSNVDPDWAQCQARRRAPAPARYGPRRSKCQVAISFRAVWEELPAISARALPEIFLLPAPPCIPIRPR